MKTPLYGYMTVTDEMSDAEVKRNEDAMAAYAEAGGYTLDGILHEYAPERMTVLADLTAVLRDTGTRHVIVPSELDFGCNDILRDIRLDRLEDEADAVVLELEQR